MGMSVHSIDPAETCSLLSIIYPMQQSQESRLKAEVIACLGSEQTEACD